VTDGLAGNELSRHNSVEGGGRCCQRRPLRSPAAKARQRRPRYLLAASVPRAAQYSEHDAIYPSLLFSTDEVESVAIEAVESTAGVDALRLLGQTRERTMGKFSIK
jgi:hypothetical protein